MDIKTARKALGLCKDKEQQYSLKAIKRAMFQTGNTSAPEAMIEVTLDSARKALKTFETSTLFFNHKMADLPTEEIETYLEEIGKYESVLDPTGQSSVQEIKERIDNAPKRAHFIVDCRKYMTPETNKQSYTQGIVARILKEIIDCIDSVDKSILDEFAKASQEKEKIIQTLTSIANLSVIRERFEEFTKETKPQIRCAILERIRDHLDYANNNISAEKSPLPVSMIS